LPPRAPPPPPAPPRQMERVSEAYDVPAQRLA